MSLHTSIKQKAKTYSPYLIQVRRHLHAHPELSFQEIKTAAYLSEQLKKKNIEHQTGIVNTGIIALIKGKNPDKKCILIRGDLDALPIDEKNKVPYQSTQAHVMHACGHDVHSTCVLGAAFILNELKDHFEGTVKIMFQPGEEVLPGGASLMIEAGVLENPKVHAALALHVFPNLQAGEVGFKSGMYMASTDEIYLNIIGTGGHAAMPQEYNNPLLIASEILLALNKEFPNQATQKIPTVLAFGKITGNGATNVIPEQVNIEGTFRTMDENWRQQAHHKIKTIVHQVAQEKKATAHVEIKRGYPFLINNEALTLQTKKTAQDYLGKKQVFDLPLRMTAEDFAYITQQVPSCFFRLGTNNAANEFASGVHTPTFDIDERAIETGAGLLAAMALTILNE
ncbi:MAG: amidohydrolase [Bacteroidetes bacterium]|nr:amidohydrolase [Bacteroidota bacterium]